MVLTADGDRYWNEVRGKLLELSDASGRMRRRAKGQELRLSSNRLLVVYEFVLPRLTSLRARFPALELRLENSTEPRRLRSPQRYRRRGSGVGGGPWLRARDYDIGAVTSCAVCSPDLARRGAKPGRSAQDAADQSIALQDIAASLASLKKRDRTFEPVAVVLVGSMLEMLLAADQGLGVGWGLFPLATNWVTSGRIAVPFPTRVRVPGQVALVHRPEERRRDPLGQLAQWVREQYEQLPQLPAGRIVRTEGA